ncbi:hypothetical protein [Bradyrhizobium sp. 930_D9_N1_4]|uniref:hypothetical protein n=1 Tax=Bradyrhizobium sp. 930_D9_N1_4 TaxID=3240374 RepID=UPI003F8BD89D
MNLNKDAESWARVDPRAVTQGSQAQAENVLKMALQDIAKLAAELETVQNHRARVGRNRDMWKAQCERQADQLRAFTSQHPSQQGNCK